MTTSHAEKMLKRIQLPNVYWETRLSKVSECEGKKILTDWIMPMSKEGSGSFPRKVFIFTASSEEASLLQPPSHSKHV